MGESLAATKSLPSEQRSGNVPCHAERRFHRRRVDQMTPQISTLTPTLSARAPSRLRHVRQKWRISARTPAVAPPRNWSEHSALPPALTSTLACPSRCSSIAFQPVKQWPRSCGTFAICTVIRCVSRPLKTGTLCGTLCGSFSRFAPAQSKRREVAAHECFRLAEPTGLKPATSGVTGRRSNADGRFLSGSSFVNHSQPRMSGSF